MISSDWPITSLNYSELKFRYAIIDAARTYLSAAGICVFRLCATVSVAKLISAVSLVTFPKISWVVIDAFLCRSWHLSASVTPGGISAVCNVQAIHNLSVNHWRTFNSLTMLERHIIFYINTLCLVSDNWTRNRLVWMRGFCSLCNYVHVCEMLSYYAGLHRCAGILSL